MRDVDKFMYHLQEQRRKKTEKKKEEKRNKRLKKGDWTRLAAWAARWLHFNSMRWVLVVRPTERKSVCTPKKGHA
jgi:hypothetical protein